MPYIGYGEAVKMKNLMLVTPPVRERAEPAAGQERHVKMQLLLCIVVITITMRSIVILFIPVMGNYQPQLIITNHQ